MTASPPLTDPIQISPKSLRRRTAANAAADSPTSKRLLRATRALKTTAGREANGVEDKDKVDKSGKRNRTETVLTEEVPRPLPEGAPKKTRQRREVKQEIKDPQEKESPVGETSSSRTKLAGDQEPASLQVDDGTPQTVKRKRVVKVEEAEIEVGEPSSKKTKRKKATESKIDEAVEDKASPSKAKRKIKVKEEDEEIEEGEGGQKKTKRKRKTKEEKELEAMPLAVRTDGLRMFIGAHVSGAKGWSFLMYIEIVELRLVFKSRSPQFCHKLRTHRVNEPPNVTKQTNMTDMLSAEMLLPCSLNHRKSGRTLLCKTVTEISSKHCVVSISTTQSSTEPILYLQPILTHPNPS